MRTKTLIQSSVYVYFCMIWHEKQDMTHPSLSHCFLMAK